MSSRHDEPIQAVIAFVDLHRAGRSEPLTEEAKRQYGELAVTLRNIIDGAVGPPSSPSPDKARPTGEGILSANDASRLQEVNLKTNTLSAYTRSSERSASDAYYGGPVTVPDTAPAAPVRAVTIDGHAADLPASTRRLWSVGHNPVADDSSVSAEMHVPSPQDSHPNVDISSGRSEPSENRRNVPLDRGTTVVSKSTPVEPSAPPAIVHLTAGGTLRGTINRFDSAAGRLVLEERGDEGHTRDIRLEDVLAIFFGRRPNARPTPRDGIRVEVTLINDRQLEGFTNDYRPNGIALTIVPHTERNGIDRVWVPAWAVKSITTD